MAETAAGRDPAATGRSVGNVPASCEFDFSGKGNVLAYFKLHYGDFTIKGFKVMDGKPPWVAFPSKKVGKGDDGRWMTTSWIENETRYEAFRVWALKCYETAKAAHVAS